MCPLACNDYELFSEGTQKKKNIAVENTSRVSRIVLMEVLNI